MPLLVEGDPGLIIKTTTVLNELGKELVEYYDDDDDDDYDDDINKGRHKGTFSTRININIDTIANDKDFILALDDDDDDDNNNNNINNSDDDYGTLF